MTRRTFELHDWRGTVDYPAECDAFSMILVEHRDGGCYHLGHLDISEQLWHAAVRARRLFHTLRVYRRCLKRQASPPVPAPTQLELV